MINKPLVSIVIPVYNGSNYLREAIDSAINQIYQNIEILVINDGSTDNGDTEKIALSYGEKIQYFYKKNGGVATALNFGIQKMQGEYFSWLSHDDLYLPTKIEKQIDFLCQEQKSPIVLYSDVEFIDKDSKHLDELNINHQHYLYSLFGGLINGCTLLIPKECFQTCGVFDTALITTQDYDMWFRIAQKYIWKHIPEPLVQSRQHSQQGQNTISSHNKERELLHKIIIKKLTSRHILEIEENISIFYLKISKLLIKRKLFASSYITIKKFIKSSDFSVFNRILFGFILAFQYVFSFCLSIAEKIKNSIYR